MGQVFVGNRGVISAVLNSRLRILFLDADPFKLIIRMN